MLYTPPTKAGIMRVTRRRLKLVGEVTENGTSRELDPRHIELLQGFSRRLRDAREAKFPKLTQERACREIGVSLRQYQRWEHGEQFPPFERISKIVEVTGVDVSDLFEPQGAMTRDSMKDYFDNRIEQIVSLTQANQSLVQQSMEDLEELMHDLLKGIERVERALVQGQSR